MGTHAALPRDGERYELLSELASGGMATVYLARMRRPLGFARLVAIKCMHPQFAKDPSFTTMFLDEARITARLRHPNIVPTLDIVADDGHLLLVMEYVEGESLVAILRSLKKAGTRIPYPIACAIVHDVLLGLHEAHEAKDDDGAPLAIIHRDVSPHNVIVGIDGLARVLDFGVAKARHSTHHTNDNEIKGKIPYMPPEQLYGEQLDRRVDVYAAGVTLWESLVGTRLFEGPSETALVRRITEEPVLPPSMHVEIPPALDRLVMRALSHDPNLRFQTALEMAEELAACVSLPTRTEVSAWVKQFVTPRAVPSSPEPIAVADARTTIVAVLEKASQKLPSFRRTTVDVPPARRRFPMRAVIAACAAVAVVVTGAAFAKVNQAPPASTASIAASAGVIGDTAPRAEIANTPEGANAPEGTTTTESAPEVASAPVVEAPAAPVRPATAKPVSKPRFVPAAPADDAKGASCRPPYTVDANGHRHYKVECL